MGGSLALTGGLFQAMLRDSLATPYTLGVSAGAALGAVTTLALDLDSAARFSRVVDWLDGGRRRRASDGCRRVMEGRPHFRRPTSSHWNLAQQHLLGIHSADLWRGSRTPLIFHHAVAAGQRRFRQLHRAGCFRGCCGGILASSCCARHAPGTSSRSANPGPLPAVWICKRVMLTGYICGSVLTAGAIALSGPIGFVGLVVPHLVRSRISRGQSTPASLFVSVGWRAAGRLRRRRPHRSRSRGTAGRCRHGGDRRTLFDLGRAEAILAMAQADLRRRHFLACRQELDGHRDLCVAATAWSPGGALQGAEHVQQFLPVPRGRRNRPRAGGTGVGVRARPRTRP